MVGAVRSDESCVSSGGAIGICFMANATPFVTAIIHRALDSFGVSFPDLPGCVAQGSTEQEALANSADAVALHIEGLVTGGDIAPVPRSLDDLRADPEFADDFAGADALALVPITLPGRSVRINLTMDENLLAAIDRAAERSGATRSGFLADAARAKLSAG